MKEYRCTKCNRLLFKDEHAELNFAVEVRCKRCKTLLVFRGQDTLTSARQRLSSLTGDSVRPVERSAAGLLTLIELAGFFGPEFQDRFDGMFEAAFIEADSQGGWSGEDGFDFRRCVGWRA